MYYTPQLNLEQLESTKNRNNTEVERILFQVMAFIFESFRSIRVSLSTKAEQGA